MRPEYVFYLFVVLFEFGIGATMTFFTPLLLDIGLGLQDLALIGVIFHLSTICFEVPTGMIADRYGRGASVAMGALLLVVSGVMNVVMRDFTTAVCAELLSGFACACISGALQAWMLDAPGRTLETHTLFAHYSTVRTSSFIAGNVAAIFVVPHYGIRSAFVLMTIVLGLACVVAGAGMWRHEGPRRLTEGQVLGMALDKLRHTPSLQWAVAMRTLMSAIVTLHAYWIVFMQTRLTLAEVGWMGTSLIVPTMAASWTARTAVGRRLQEGGGRLLGAACAWTTLACFSVEQSTATWCGLLMLNEFGCGLFRIYTDSYMNERVEEAYRATFGSLASFCMSVGCAAALGVTAIVFHGRDPSMDMLQALWFWTGIVCLTVTAVLWRLQPK